MWLKSWSYIEDYVYRKQPILLYTRCTMTIKAMLLSFSQVPSREDLRTGHGGLHIILSAPFFWGGRRWVGGPSRARSSASAILRELAVVLFSGQKNLLQLDLIFSIFMLTPSLPRPVPSGLWQKPASDAAPLPPACPLTSLPSHYKRGPLRRRRENPLPKRSQRFGTVS